MNVRPLFSDREAQARARIFDGGPAPFDRARARLSFETWTALITIFSATIDSPSIDRVVVGLDTSLARGARELGRLGLIELEPLASPEFLIRVCWCALEIFLSAQSDEGSGNQGESGTGGGGQRMPNTGRLNRNTLPLRGASFETRTILSRFYKLFGSRRAA